MTEAGEHHVVVEFEADPAEQQRALERIGAYVESFLSRQPGFIASTLLAGTDGRSIVHHARWQSEAHFQRAGEQARSHPDLPALRAYAPRGRGFSAWRHFP